MNRRIAELERYVRALGNTHIEGFNRRSGSGGISFVESERDNAPRWHDKTVVITVAPVEGDTTLKVREARYKNLPPRPCTGDGESATCFYEWSGSEFDVFPPLGMKAVAFAGDENTADVLTVPPKLTTKFHRVHREGDVWVLEAPATALQIDSVRIINIIGNPNTSERLNVVRVHENDQGAIVDNGGAVEGGYATWYYNFGRHYAQFIGRTPPVVLPALFVNGDWRVLQLHRFKSASPTGPVATSLCGT